MNPKSNNRNYSELFEAAMMNAIFDMVMGNDKEGTCCVCGKHYNNYGNNAKPYMQGRCCDKCNTTHVMPLRLALMSL